LIVGALLPLVVLIGACSNDTTGRAEGTSSTPSESQGNADSDRATEGPLEPAPAGTDACAEVRAGIDAFNVGEFEETVEHFVAAVPLAAAQLDRTESIAGEDLLEAVRYYAELAPDDYPAAALTSPEFAKYKQITLSQCGSPQPPPADGDEDDGAVIA